MSEMEVDRQNNYFIDRKRWLQTAPPHLWLGSCIRPVDWPAEFAQTKDGIPPFPGAEDSAGLQEGLKSMGL